MTARDPTTQMPPIHGEFDVVDAVPLGEALPLNRPPDTDPSVAEEPPGGGVSRRRLAVLSTVVALVIGGIAVVLLRDEPAPPPKPDIAFDAWVPYWTLDASNEVASQRLASMREVSPFWFNATGVDTIEIDPNADDAATDEFLASAASSGVTVIPSIVDALPAGEMAAILADPDTRSRHVDTVVSFVEEGGFAGVDLDYEQFAFADGRDTWASTRPHWVAFVEELSVRLRADDRSLTVSIPPVYDDGRTDESGFWVYDYGAIAGHVDRIRIMAYDFSVGDPGPIAPLQFVQRAIDGALEATDAPDTLVLGVPAYGRNWPIGTTGDCVGVELEGTTTVNTRTVDDLVALRGASPEFDAVTGEWSFEYDLAIEGTSCVQQRRVYYVDGDGVRLRMDLARDAGLGGVSLWAFGFDDDDMWAEILPTVSDG